LALVVHLALLRMLVIVAPTQYSAPSLQLVEVGAAVREIIRRLVEVQVGVEEMDTVAV